MGELKLSNIHYTIEEYFQIDKESEYRHEYEQGKIRRMLRGTTIKHNDIVGNLLFAIHSIFKGRRKDARFFSKMVLLETKPKEVYYYPDFIFTTNDFGEKTTVRKPSMVAEVLSEETIIADVGIKMDNYLAMPTLKYYLIIWQDECKIRCFEKIEGKWIYSLYTEMTEIISLPQIDISLAVADIYEGIDFE